jgi:hypothetical protein
MGNAFVNEYNVVVDDVDVVDVVAVVVMRVKRVVMTKADDDDTEVAANSDSDNNKATVEIRIGMFIMFGFFVGTIENGSRSNVL